jgi:hypothetical protein
MITCEAQDFLTNTYKLFPPHRRHTDNGMKYQAFKAVLFLVKITQNTNIKSTLSTF